MSWRKAGKAAGGAMLDGVREWVAVIGGLGAGLAAGLVIWQGGAGSVPGILGIAAFVACGLAVGT